MKLHLFSLSWEVTCYWVRSQMCCCLVSWFCYQNQVIRKPDLSGLTHIHFLTNSAQKRSTLFSLPWRPWTCGKAWVPRRRSQYCLWVQSPRIWYARTSLEMINQVIVFSHTNGYPKFYIICMIQSWVTIISECLFPQWFCIPVQARPPNFSWELQKNIRYTE